MAGLDDLDRRAVDRAALEVDDADVHVALAPVADIVLEARGPDLLVLDARGQAPRPDEEVLEAGHGLGRLAAGQGLAAEKFPDGRAAGLGVHDGGGLVGQDLGESPGGLRRLAPVLGHQGQVPVVAAGLAPELGHGPEEPQALGPGALVLGKGDVPRRRQDQAVDRRLQVVLELADLGRQVGGDLGPLAERSSARRAGRGLPAPPAAWPGGSGPRARPSRRPRGPRPSTRPGSSPRGPASGASRARGAPAPRPRRRARAGGRGCCGRRGRRSRRGPNRRCRSSAGTSRRRGPRSTSSGGRCTTSAPG